MMTPNELIEIDGYSPLRAEKYMDMILFYVGEGADLRYAHDNRGRPTTERQLLGNSPHYKSVINPLGIRMNDIDIIMNSGKPEISHKEWDGKYILFEDGGTFTTGKPVNYFDSNIQYDAESFEAPTEFSTQYLDQKAANLYKKKTGKRPHASNIKSHLEYLSALNDKDYNELRMMYKKLGEGDLSNAKSYHKMYLGMEKREAESFDAESDDLDCPPATQDVAINTKNRNATIKEYGYGPLNVDEPDDFWEEIAKQWETSVDAAKKSKCGDCVAFDRSPRMKDCMPGETSDGEGVLGYCWMHHFKCHSARTCDTWAKGGPITKDKVSNGWQERAFAKKEAEGDEDELISQNDIWSPEKEAIEQIKRSPKLMEEFPMIGEDSQWNRDEVNEWSPERQTIEEIRGNSMYEDEFPYLGDHPGYYDNDGNWVEKYNPEMYEPYYEYQLPWWIQLGIGIGSVTGLTYLLSKMSK